MKTIQPLGDQAALIYFDEEQAALAFAGRVRAAARDWLVDVVSSYASVAIFFDADRIRYQAVADELHTIEPARLEADARPARLHRVPCCYELGLDLDRVAEATRLSTAEVISLHSSPEYVVYAIGFCPGFPYLGYLDERLCNLPRLPSPRVRLDAGSVGLTGRQTGIYTEARPGGWNIVGRTPLTLVDVEDKYFPLRTGDRLRFEPIDRAAFDRLYGKRL